tara:strand:- start:171 stop:1262 length:1092 start_codon:yes stop_codon:yes gene_type:complete
MSDKVLVAMSGGVDSSVALLKVIEAGYDAIGVTMKLWEYKDVGGNIIDDSNCCSVSSINNAKLVCDRLNIPHYTLDFTENFRENVVENFASEYLNGRTPNPCVRCNSFVKWDTFIKEAKKLNAKYIATGHYARIIKSNNSYVLKKGFDKNKDQSYVLWGIPKETLQKTILPLGELTKKEVRKIANINNFETANIPESMEICFVADNNYKRFLKDYKPNEMSKVGKGNIIDQGGDIIGEHSGYTNYTVGQRKGLNLSKEKPHYVTKIDSNKNNIFVGEKVALLDDSCKVSNVNWLVKDINFPCNIESQIRYNSKVISSKIIIRKGEYEVHFSEPQLAITPGQSIVFYKEDIVLGGGIIEKIIKS